MDTEAIAQEIVRIRGRLNELDSDVEGARGTDAADERTELVDRLRHLQAMLSGAGPDHAEQDEPGDADSIQYIPPA